MKTFAQIRRRIVFMALDPTTGGTLKFVSVTPIGSVRCLKERALDFIRSVSHAMDPAKAANVQQ